MSEHFSSTVQFKINNNNYNFVWPVSDTETLRVIVEEWAAHIPRILARLKNRRTVVQAGGHCGVYPRLYSELFKHVFTFEPELQNFTHLAYNCTDTRITKLNVALSDRNELLSMAMVSYQNTGMNKVLPRGIHGLIGYGMTLDSIKPVDVDLIHLDIEGHEYEALRGAEKTIKKYKPVIVLEMTHNIDKTYKLMEKYGYEEVEDLKGHSKNAIFEYKNG